MKNITKYINKKCEVNLFITYWDGHVKGESIPFKINDQLEINDCTSGPHNVLLFTTDGDGITKAEEFTFDGFDQVTITYADSGSRK